MSRAVRHPDNSARAAPVTYNPAMRLALDPDYDSLRDDPPFQALLHTLR